jgi:fumarate reductase subunit D
MAKRTISTELFLWALFGARGLLAALLIPILLLLFGVLYPLGWAGAPNYPHLLAVLRHPLTRIDLLALCVLALFHWAHRFRYPLFDGLQLKGHSELIGLLCYGGAVVGSAVAAGFLLGPIPR